MIASTVRAFKGMRTQFTYFYFKARRIRLRVSFATLAKLMMVFRLVRPVALDTFGPLDSTRECGVTSFPAIFTLWNPRVHVSTSNSRNELTDVEASVNEGLGFTATLSILYIDPNDCYV